METVQISPKKENSNPTL